MSEEKENGTVDLKDKTLDEDILNLVSGGQKPSDTCARTCMSCPLPRLGVCNGP